MDSLAQMQLFLKVAEAGSFSAAGRTVGMSTSSVSRKIATLEENLGLNLFLRGGQKLVLTEAGVYYQRRVLSLVDEIEQARLDVQSFQEKPKGLIRITTVAQFVESFLWRILPEFIDTYPDIRVELRVDDRFANLVRENVDLAFRVGKLDDSGLIARRIGSNIMCLAASPEYLDKHGRPQTIEDLGGHQIITYWNNTAYNTWRLWEGDQCHKFTFEAKIQTNSGPVMCDAALKGMGITLLPYWSLADHIRAGKLESLLEEAKPEYSQIAGDSIYALYPHASGLQPKVRVFLDFAVAHFNTMMRCEPDGQTFTPA